MFHQVAAQRGIAEQFLHRVLTLGDGRGIDERLFDPGRIGNIGKLFTDERFCFFP